jgi:IS1 family transposase
MFYEEIQETSKPEKLSNITGSYMTTNLLKSFNLVGVCTDAHDVYPALMGLQVLTHGKSPSAVWTQRTIHRQGLASKHLRSELERVLEKVTKVVNYIKTRPLKAKKFARLCEKDS